LHGGNRNALMFALGQKQTSDCRLSPVDVRFTSKSGHAPSGGTQNSRQKRKGSIPFSRRWTFLEKAKQNQNLILAKGAQGRQISILTFQ
jgi:hypothetical protein